jgi:hypothetical protein
VLLRSWHKISLLHLAVILVCNALSASASKASAPLSSTSPPFDPSAFWNSYSQYRLSPTHPEQITHEFLSGTLKRLGESYPAIIAIEEIGKSVKGKTLCLVRIGKGNIPVLIWSQQHGDEAKCTAALLDFINFLCAAQDSSIRRTILENTQLVILPMVNPDGAEKDARRNAQGLDINRDAQMLQTPEGRVLKGLHLNYHPKFCFNLHDHGPRRTVKTTRKVVALSLQASLFDEHDNDNPVRIRAKKVIGRIYEAVSSFAYGHIARYEADYMPRAFGDSMMRWGASSILIESGGWLGGPDDDEMVVKLHCLALTAAVYAIASESYEDANPGLYDTLPEFGRAMVDLAIRGATIIDGSGIPPFKADVGINVTARYRPGETQPVYSATIDDVGDLSIIESKKTIEADGFILTPGFVSVAPFISSKDLTTTSAMLSYPKAGITTIVCTGPSPECDAMGELTSLPGSPMLPINLYYYDFAPSLQALREQNFFHAHTGVFVAPRPVSSEMLLSLLEAGKSSLSADTTSNADGSSPRMNVWLAFSNRGTPSRNALHFIADTPPHQDHTADPKDDAELHEFMQCTLDNTSRIRLAVNPFSGNCADALLCPEKIFFNIHGSDAVPELLARIAERLRRNHPDLTLPQVVQKLTSLPATCCGFGRKGLIRAGYDADLALFPITMVYDSSTVEYIDAGKLHTLIVNGIVVIENGVATGRYPGKIVSGD